MTALAEEKTEAVGAPTLRRAMGFRDLLLFYLVTGFSLRWIAQAAAAGPSSVVIWIIGALALYVPLVFTVLELSSRFPEEGGLYSWTRRAFGEFPGYLSGYLYWSSNLPYFPSLFYFTAANALFIFGHRFEALQNLIHPTVGVRHLSHYIAFELSGYSIDGPLPDIPLGNLNVSRTEMLFKLARRENLTIRQLYQRIAGGRGHFQTFGTPQQVADMMEEWVTTGACDGFNYMAPIFPSQLDEFVATVIPELQRRGLYRTRYEASTLRGNLGIPRRESRYVRQQVAETG